MLYWSLQGKMPQFRRCKFICEVKTSFVLWLSSMGSLMRTYNTGLEWYWRQFPCILCIVSTKSLLGSCGLYNVHEKFLIEGECKLNIKKHREKRSYSAFHKTFDKRVSEVRLKFQKLLRTWQFHYVVVNQIVSFKKKLWISCWISLESCKVRHERSARHLV